jgi:hypothetical protein
MHRTRRSDTPTPNRAIRTALQGAADEAERRRKVVRFALMVLAGVLLLLGMLLLGDPI